MAKDGEDCGGGGGLDREEEDWGETGRRDWLRLGFSHWWTRLIYPSAKRRFYPERLRRNNGHCHRARRGTEISSHQVDDRWDQGL